MKIPIVTRKKNPLEKGQMPVFWLPEENVFPPVDKSEPDGLLAVGGDLSPGRLLEAYRNGIFPWFNEDDPFLWWSPDPRMMIVKGDFHCSRNLRKILRQKRYTVSFDRAFSSVIQGCADSKTPRRIGTWITKEMLEAYCQLHELGYAHSVEVWNNKKLVGGMYGISLGGCFFGESMFSREPSVSKVAMAWLFKHFDLWDFDLLDCQMPTPHLFKMGGKLIPRAEFKTILSASLKRSDKTGKWDVDPKVNF